MSDYYIKRGRKYIKAGFSGPELHEGVWLVTQKPGIRSQKNLVVKLSELPNPVDLQKLASYELLVDKLAGFLSEITTDGWTYQYDKQGERIIRDDLPKIGRDFNGNACQVGIYNISMNDLASQIMTYLFKEYGK